MAIIRPTGAKPYPTKRTGTQFIVEETDAQRRERVAADERKRHAEATAALLRQRYGVIDED